MFPIRKALHREWEVLAGGGTGRAARRESQGPGRSSRRRARAGTPPPLAPPGAGPGSWAGLGVGKMAWGDPHTCLHSRQNSTVHWRDNLEIMEGHEEFRYLSEVSSPTCVSLSRTPAVAHSPGTILWRGRAWRRALTDLASLVTSGPRRRTKGALDPAIQAGRCGAINIEP